VPLAPAVANGRHRIHAAQISPGPPHRWLQRHSLCSVPRGACKNGSSCSGHVKPVQPEHGDVIRALAKLGASSLRYPTTSASAMPTLTTDSPPMIDASHAISPTSVRIDLHIVVLPRLLRGVNPAGAHWVPSDRYLSTGKQAPRRDHDRFLEQRCLPAVGHSDHTAARGSLQGAYSQISGERTNTGRL